MLSCFTFTCIFVRSLGARRVRWGRHSLFRSLGPRVWTRPWAGMITWWIFRAFRFHRHAPWLTSSTTLVAAVPFTWVCSLPFDIRRQTSRIWPTSAFVGPRTTWGNGAFARPRWVAERGRSSWRVARSGVRVFIIIVPVRSLIVSGVITVAVTGRLVRLVVIVGRGAVVRVADASPRVSGGHGSRLRREGAGRGRGRWRLMRRILRLSARRPAVPRAARGAIWGHTFA